MGRIQTEVDDDVDREIRALAARRGVKLARLVREELFRMLGAEDARIPESEAMLLNHDLRIARIERQLKIRPSPD